MNESAKLRDLAHRLVDVIQDKRRNRLDNTPKRARQAAAARIDANHLDRVREAAVMLADAMDAGTLSREMSGVTWSKQRLMDYLQTEVESGNRGHYSIRDTGEWRQACPMAVMLRAWIEDQQSVSDANAKEYQAQRDKIAEMERKIRFTKIDGFFPTPPAVIEMMIDRLLLDEPPFYEILEPSAGKGDIVDALLAKQPGRVCHCYEINYSLREILEAKHHTIIGHDFMDPDENLPGGTPDGLYRRIIMNPPFELLQDVDHVRRAYSLLRPGNSRLVSLMSGGAFFQSNRKAQDFQEWFDSIDGGVEDVPEGAFKNGFAPTGVNCKMVVINGASS